MTRGVLLRVWTFMVSVHFFISQVCGESLEGTADIMAEQLSDLPALLDLTVREGSSVVIQCNVSEVPDSVVWYNSRGPILIGDRSDGKWTTVENDQLNISSVSFEDRGRYTCVAFSSAGIYNYTVTLRVSYTHSGLGLYYVIICLVAFSITLILNITRLCMVGTHLRKTERALNDFFRVEGAEKLAKAFEIAKRIPIVTSAKTLEFAKVTQFKTMEFARHVDHLARSIPLPPLILNCRTLEDDVLDKMPDGRVLPALGENPAPVQQTETAEGESPCLNIRVSVHHLSETEPLQPPRTRLSMRSCDYNK